MTAKHTTTISTLLLGLCVGSVAADTIELRRSVRRAHADAPVRLRDVAHLDGDYVAEFGSVVLADRDAVSDRRVHVLDVHAVRDRLTEAGVLWGRVDLVGREVRVRPVAVAPNARGASGDPSPVARSGGTDARTLPTSSTGGFAPATTFLSRPEGDLQRVIAELMLEGLGDEPGFADRVLLSLDLANLDRLLPDHELDVELATSIGPETSVRVVGKANNGRHLVDRSVHVSVATKVIRLVPVAVTDIRRTGTRTIERADLRFEERAIPFRQVVPDLESLVGATPIRTIKAGEPIESSMLQPLIVVKRNTAVSIISVIDGVHKVTLPGYTALKNGAIGDVVTCRAESGEAEITAVVTGPGLLEIRQP